MPVITINGVIGSGPIEVGQMVAQQLNLNYVDRLVLAEAAKLIGSPVGALVQREQQGAGFRQRVSRFLREVIESSAMPGLSDDHDFGFGAEMLPAETYPELAGDPSSQRQRLNDAVFIQATTQVIQKLARQGNVVIIGRGANMILADVPGVVNVGMVAPLETRIETLMQREHFTREEARAYAESVEQARLIFFRKFFKVEANNPALYDLVLNLGRMSQQTAAAIIVDTAKNLASPVP